MRRAAVDLPIQVLVNAPGATVDQLLAEASLFWHGAGFGEDPEQHPDRFEHFGIAVVEAMAAGAVPIVYDAAGPAEIVRDGVEGRTWRTIGELLAVPRPSPQIPRDVRPSPPTPPVERSTSPRIGSSDA